MLRIIRSVAALAGLTVLLAVGLASAAEKPKAPDDPPKPCAVYGPGFEPLGNSGVCIRIGGSVDFGVSSSGHGGSSSVANSADWIRGKPAKSGN